MGGGGMGGGGKVGGGMGGGKVGGGMGGGGMGGIMGGAYLNPGKYGGGIGGGTGPGAGAERLSKSVRTASTRLDARARAISSVSAELALNSSASGVVYSAPVDGSLPPEPRPTNCTRHPVWDSMCRK